MAETYTYFSRAGVNAIARGSDGAFISLDLANRDYQEFLRWVAEPNPAPEGWTGPLNPTPEEVA